MKSFILPDVNVWLALTYLGHQHHAKSKAWYASLNPDVRLCFCRQSQLGLLRLLNNPAVLQDETLTQRQSWEIFDEWILSGRAIFLEEPAGLDRTFRRLTHYESHAPKAWADAYLSAFAEAGEFTLITFDRAFANKTKGAVLLT